MTASLEVSAVRRWQRAGEKKPKKNSMISSWEYKMITRAELIRRLIYFSIHDPPLAVFSSLSGLHMAVRKTPHSSLYETHKCYHQGLSNVSSHSIHEIFCQRLYILLAVDEIVGWFLHVMLGFVGSFDPVFNRFYIDMWWKATRMMISDILKICAAFIVKNDCWFNPSVKKGSEFSFCLTPWNLFFFLHENH